MKKESIWTVANISKIAIVAALYAALTVVLAPISYGNIQVRISEFLVLLCFYSKKYGISLTLGCLIANLFSPLGWYDIVFGTLATLLAVICIMFTKNIVVAGLWAVIFNGLIVGLEISILDNLSFWICAGEVALGEIIAVLVIGCPIFKIIEKTAVFKKIVA